MAGLLEFIASFLGFDEASASPRIMRLLAGALFVLTLLFIAIVWVISLLF